MSVKVVMTAWRKATETLEQSTFDIDWNFLTDEQLAAMNTDLRSARLDGAEALLHELINANVLIPDHSNLQRTLRAAVRAIDRFDTNLATIESESNDNGDS